MSNHWHVVCYAPAESPGLDEISARFNAYYGGQRVEPNWRVDSEACEHYAARMRDISMFAKDLQQQFTRWFNRTRPQGRCGRLWADRFKSVILDENSSLWECLQYVTMNPVRAGLCEDAADYRFGAWGRFCGSGRHPFGLALVKHLRRHLGECGRNFSDEEVITEFRVDRARRTAAEHGKSTKAIVEAKEKARSGGSAGVVISRRIRYFSDSGILGSRLFVVSMTAKLFGPERAQTKRYGKTICASGVELFALRQLRNTA